MIWASALSTLPTTSAALTELKRAVDQQLDGRRPDLVCAFASSHHGDSYLQIAQRISAHFSPRASIGCSAAGLVGGVKWVNLDAGQVGGTEDEGRPLLFFISTSDQPSGAATNAGAR